MTKKESKKESKEVKETDDIKEVKEIEVPQKSNGFLDDIIEMCRWAKVKIEVKISNNQVVDGMPIETASRQPTPKKRRWWENKYVKQVITMFGIWIVIYPILMLILPMFVSWIITFVVGLVVSSWVMNRHYKKEKISSENKQPDNWPSRPRSQKSYSPKSQLHNLFNEDILSREIGIGSSAEVKTHQTHSVIDTFEEFEDDVTAMSGSVYVGDDVTAKSGSVYIDDEFEKMFDMKESRDSISNDEIKKTLDGERNELLKAQLDVASKEINDMLMELRAFHNTKLKNTKGTGAH